MATKSRPIRVFKKANKLYFRLKGELVPARKLLKRLYPSLTFPSNKAIIKFVQKNFIVPGRKPYKRSRKHLRKHKHRKLPTISGLPHTAIQAQIQNALEAYKRGIEKERQEEKEKASKEDLSHAQENVAQSKATIQNLRNQLALNQPQINVNNPPINLPQITFPPPAPINVYNQPPSPPAIQAPPLAPEFYAQIGPTRFEFTAEQAPEFERRIREYENVSKQLAEQQKQTQTLQRQQELSSKSQKIKAAKVKSSQRRALANSFGLKPLAANNKTKTWPQIVNELQASATGRFYLEQLADSIGANDDEAKIGKTIDNSITQNLQRLQQLRTPDKAAIKLTQPPPQPRPEEIAFQDIANLAKQEEEKGAPQPFDPSQKEADILNDILGKEGQGKPTNKLPGKGLYNDQLERIMAPFKHKGFLGVISSDEIPTLIPKIANKKKIGFIMNTLPSTAPEKEIGHWVSVYIDTANDKALEYYDSFADEPSNEFMHDIKQLIDAMDPPTYLKFKINKVVDQRSTGPQAYACGYFAASFLVNRFMGKKWTFSSGYSDIPHAEKEIAKFEKKVAQFGLI